MHPGPLIIWIWVAWLAIWMFAALWSARSTKRASAERGYWLVQFAGGLILAWSGRGLLPYDPTLWIIGTNGLWGLLAIVAAGLGFTFWARLALGKLWSGNVARKADHRIVDNGPYAVTRHPIYTGILVSLAATAVALGKLDGMIGAGILTYGFWMKARLEERFLRAELGAAAYDEYARRTPMLVPFLR